MKYKYSLIISQYHHSRHMYIVKIDENFIENARKCATEIMKYKRNGEITTKYLGDLEPEYSGKDKEMRSRYNINDAGDICFINAGYANYCMGEAFKYKEDSRRESVGFKKKIVIEAIRDHHNDNKIFEIVKKYFEIA